MRPTSVARVALVAFSTVCALSAGQAARELLGFYGPALSDVLHAYTSGASGFGSLLLWVCGAVLSLVCAFSVRAAVAPAPVTSLSPGAAAFGRIVSTLSR